MASNFESGHDPEDRQYLIMDLPCLSDEAAFQFSLLLKQFSEQFDAEYDRQIFRAARRHEREYQRRCREWRFLSAQLPLPFVDCDDELF